MATLYVENVPEDVYDAIRKRARENRTSIAREVLTALKEKFPTAEELKRRRRIFEELARLRAAEPPAGGPFPSAEELVREDRER
jgi:plasmid stability protein